MVRIRDHKPKARVTQGKHCFTSYLLYCLLVLAQACYMTRQGRPVTEQPMQCMPDVLHALECVNTQPSFRSCNQDGIKHAAEGTCRLATVSMLCANTSSPDLARCLTAVRSPRKSGVRHSTRMLGLQWMSKQSQYPTSNIASD